MSSFKAPALALAVVLLPISAHAQPTPPTPTPPTPTAPTPPSTASSFDQELDALFVAGGLTAEAAATRAQHASPEVRRAAATVDVALANVDAAELTRVPRVGATATYTRLSPLDPIVFAPGAAIEFLENSYAVQGQVAISLSDYVWRYPRLIEGARLGVVAARAGKQSTALEAAEQGRIAFYEWVRAQLQVLIARHQLADVRATLGQVRALADAQRISKADLLRVESQEAGAEQALDQLVKLAALREQQLRLLIDAGDQPLAIGEDIRLDVAVGAPAPLDDLVKLAARQRFDFRAIDAGIAAKDKQRAAEQANRYPRLSAFASVDYADPNPRVFPQENEFKLTWTAGLQLSWTLNDALIADANAKRIAAETRELRADRDNLARGTEIAVLAAQQAVELARGALVTSQKGLAAAEESYRVRQALLAADRATAVELVDAETELTRSRIAALNARIDLRVALAELAHATGADAKAAPAAK